MSTTYLAIGIYKNLLGEVYTVEIETHLSDRQEVVELLNRGNYLEYNLDTAYLIKSGYSSSAYPQVVSFWNASRGDF